MVRIFDSSQLSELAASELPDCEGIVVDCLALTASCITHNFSSRGCVSFPIDQGKLCAVCKVRPKPVPQIEIDR